MLDWSTHAHDYQARAAAFLFNTGTKGGFGNLYLSPGYGKTSITLHTFKALREAGLAQHMLVVAPLRVVQTVWAQEIEDWTSLNGLVACRLHGTKKEMWLKRRDVNVWLINYEGLPWLADMVKAGKVKTQFDVVVCDEVRRLKEPGGHRFKALRPITAMAKYRWGLTGTPASNGLMDLFGQFLILDQGATLGKRLTHYRAEFFEQGWDGFTYIPRPGAAEEIERRIAPHVFRADGLLDLPDFVFDNRAVPLDAAGRKQYDAMKKTLIAEIGDKRITAANAAVLMGKLKQMANGRVYDEMRGVHVIHSAKKAALEELIEELGDEQLLIAYEYNHDLAQIREVLGDDLPYLGAGVNEATMQDHVRRWNAGEIRVMAAHPASAGHGLNLQKSGAHHILWWGPTFDLDHYIQFNDRLHRQGNQADAVVVHTFVAEHTVDETAIKAREDKDTVQSALLAALTAEFGDSIVLEGDNTGESTMTSLVFKSDAAQASNPFAAGAAPAANPFAAAPAVAGAGNSAPTGNPFAQAAAPAANPFAAQAEPRPNITATPEDRQPPVANPFAQGAAPAANPFAQGAAPSQAQQVQTIIQDVAAQPLPTPAQVAPTNPFAAKPQPVADAEEVAEPALAWQPQLAGTAEAVVENAKADIAKAVTAVEHAVGHVPLYLHIPADKMEKVLAAIARAVK